MNKSLDVLAFFDLLIRDHKLTCGVSDKADVLYYNLDNIISGHLFHEEFKVRDYERRVVIDTNFSNKFLNQSGLTLSFNYRKIGRVDTIGGCALKSPELLDRKRLRGLE